MGWRRGSRRLPRLIEQKVHVVPMKICLLALLGLSIIDGSTETGSAAQLILRIFPQQVTLFGGGARQTVLVTTMDSLGVERDVTRQVQLQVDDEQIAELEEDNVIRGLRAGSTTVRAVWRRRQNLVFTRLASSRKANSKTER